MRRVEVSHDSAQLMRRATSELMPVSCSQVIGEYEKAIYLSSGRAMSCDRFSVSAVGLTVHTGGSSVSRLS